jgi:hypothetical protein
MNGLKLAAVLRKDAEDCARPDRAGLLVAAAMEIEALVEECKALNGALKLALDEMETARDEYANYVNDDDAELPDVCLESAIEAAREALGIAERGAE